MSKMTATNRAPIIFILGIILSLVYSKGFTVSPVSLLEGLALAIFLSWFITKLDLEPWSAFLIVWLGIFVIGAFNNMLEGYFFTKVYPSFGAFISAIPTAFITTFLESAAALLILRAKGKRDLANALRTHLGSRTASSWVKRMIASSVLYLPIYFFFGMLVSPFVVPYYSSSPGLVIPPVPTIETLEIIRGVIYTVVLLFVFATVGKERKMNFIVASTFLYIPGAALPLVSAMSSSNFLSAVAPYHLVELFGDSVVYGYAASRLIST